MKNYRVTIHGRTLEGCDLRRLVARAVREKKSQDRVLRFLVSQKRPSQQDQLDVCERGLDSPISRSGG
jgi:hypothetical protein